MTAEVSTAATVCHSIRKQCWEALSLTDMDLCLFQASESKAKKRLS